MTRRTPTRRTPPRRTPPRRASARPRRRRRHPRTLPLGNPGRRLRVGLLVMGFVLSLFVGRLLQLQGIDASAYASVAERERLRTVALPATRGAITDRNGIAFASTVDARAITADPTLVAKVDETARLLATYLDVSERELRAELSRKDRRFVYLARQVSPAAWTQVRELRLAGSSSGGLPGVFSEPESKRVYPADAVAANVVGFVGADGHGSGGLELSLDRQLSGRDGVVTYETGAGGRQIPTAASAETRALPGEDVRLTIDRDIQWVAQRAIAKRVRQSHSESGTVVVMDPRNGQILALATAPSFDPNRPGDAAPADRNNRALGDVYEPGSTSKVMTAAAAIEHRAVTPKTPFTVPGTLYRHGKLFHDAEPHPTEKLTFAGVLAKSSNIGTIKAAERLGFKRLYAVQRKFGIGQPTGLGFPGESQGVLPAPPDWSATTPYTIAFGQGLSINAVQGASVFATIANHGVRVQPSLVKGYAGADGTLRPAKAGTRTRVVSPRAARQVRRMLEGVVADGGTAPMAAIPGYRVAGKTGTAQRVNPRCGCYRGYTASFIGFAPADKPRLVVSVSLQDPHGIHFGGLLGGPVFKEVTSFALQSLKVPPTGSKAPKMRLTWGG